MSTFLITCHRHRHHHRLWQEILFICPSGCISRCLLLLVSWSSCSLVYSFVFLHKDPMVAINVAASCLLSFIISVVCWKWSITYPSSLLMLSMASLVISWCSSRLFLLILRLMSSSGFIIITASTLCLWGSLCCLPWLSLSWWSDCFDELSLLPWLFNLFVDSCPLFPMLSLFWVDQVQGKGHSVARFVRYDSMIPASNKTCALFSRHFPLLMPRKTN